MATSAHVSQLLAQHGRVLALVDDAQAISPEVRRDLQAVASDDAAVLLVSTERLEARDDETLIAAQSVKVLDAFCRKNIDTVAPLLSRLDDRVKWSSFFEKPDERLDLALRSAPEPWLYMFVASGGERRIINALDRAVDDGVAALVLAAICVEQLTSRDAGIESPRLKAALMRQHPDWFPSDALDASALIDEALKGLAQERLTHERDGRLRAAHIRIAQRALQDLALRESREIGAEIRRTVRSVFLDERIDIIGKYWLFQTFDVSDAYRRKYAKDLVDEPVMRALLHQASTVNPGLERGIALQLLHDADRFHALSTSQSAELVDRLIEWLPTLVSSEARGVRYAINDVRSAHPDMYAALQAAATPALLAARLSVAGERWAAMSWAELIQELLPAWSGGVLDEWSAAFESALDVRSLADWLSLQDERSEPFEIYDLIDLLALIAPHAAKVALEACGENIRAAMETDLADSVSNFHAWVFGNMTYVAMIARAPSAASHDPDDVVESGPDVDDAARRRFMASRTAATEELAASLLLLMQSVSWRRAAQSLDGQRAHKLTNLDMLFGWLAQLSTDITDELALHLPRQWITRTLENAQLGQDEAGNNDVDAIAWILQPLSFGAHGEAAIEEVVRANLHLFAPFPQSLIHRYPRLAVEVVAQGGRIAAPEMRARGWNGFVRDLQSVLGLDAAAARYWIESAAEEIRDLLTKPQENELAGIAEFIDLADSVDVVLLDSHFHELDPHVARKSWTTRIADASERIQPMLERASRVDSPAGQLALELLAGREDPAIEIPASSTNPSSLA
ncbi:hypothetical protein ABS642_21545 [Microbacterium sp. A8/3-1]|uniref:Uncharacterized protein n=1 Tax=Microbacterium sp. A8/3-1 TaxID=3160749 RepID=A0AAU7VVH2_9MICO